MQGENVPESQKIGIFADSSLIDGGLEVLRPDSVQLAKELARANHPSSDWAEMPDIEALEMLGLVLPSDPGAPHSVTLAALLLFGKTEAIQRLLPGREVEITAQLLDAEGYDFHRCFRGNLIETLARLEAFTAQNLPAGDDLPGSEGRSARDIIFREVFTNMLVHRDYSVPTPARLYFQKERVSVENPAKPRRGGVVDLSWRESHPKNPLIYGVFQKMGLIRNPGQGMETLLRFGEAYFGTRILAFDRDMYKVLITSSLEFPVRQASILNPVPVSPVSAETMQDRAGEESDEGAFAWGERTMTIQVDPWIRPKKSENRPIRPSSGLPETTGSMQDNVLGMATMQAVVVLNPESERVRKILSFCETPRNREEIQKHVGLNNRDHFRKEILLPLLRQGLLLATYPDKPNSPKQQYRSAKAPAPRGT
jgi:hypothetical protein